MRRLLLYSAFISLLFVSCKKGQNPVTPLQKKYAVKFNVTGFSQQIVGSIKGKQQISSLQTLSNPLDTAINMLYYLVFDSNSNPVSIVREQAGQSGFGTISDNLAAGTYTVIFAGSDSNLLLYTGPNAPFISPDGGLWGDVFFKKITLTVSGGDVTQNVALDRIVAKLTVNLEDALPANASYLTISSSLEYPRYLLLASMPSANAVPKPATNKFVIPVAAIGTTNFRSSILMMDTFAPINLVISCYDSSDKLLGQAVVNSVALQPNTQTILSGKLFGSSNGIDPGINAAWDPSPINISY